MSKSPPARRTRVFLACLNCRKRKIKCLTVDSEQKPCGRRVRKRLLCEYRTIAEDQEQSASAGATDSYGCKPAPSTTQAAGSCPLGNQGPHQCGNSQHSGSTLHGLTPDVTPDATHNYGVHPGFNQAYLYHSVHDSGPANAHGSSAPPPQYSDHSGYSASYGFPPNRAGFPSSSRQPQSSSSLSGLTFTVLGTLTTSKILTIAIFLSIQDQYLREVTNLGVVAAKLGPLGERHHSQIDEVLGGNGSAVTLNHRHFLLRIPSISPKHMSYLQETVSSLDFIPSEIFNV
ncbi:hypothetical protein B0H19DRAFT_1080014 [Mycena capillaripes]|nr:hypothetical protein B0H19DRAFT_1080014 [Mycena capillaripes]